MAVAVELSAMRGLICHHSLRYHIGTTGFWLMKVFSSAQMMTMVADDGTMISFRWALKMI